MDNNSAVETVEFPNLKSINRQLFSLKDSITDLERRNITIHEDIVKSTNESIADAVQKHDLKLTTSIASLNQENKALKQLVFDSEKRITDQLAKQDIEHTARDTQLYNTIDAMNKKYSKMHFDIIYNDDNIALTYVNSDGKIEYGAIEKITVDEKSLTKNRGKIQLKYQFAPANFSINTSGTINNIGLTLSNGKSISADSINNDLKNASFNISSLSTKVDSLVKKLDGIGGYTAANNFKMSNPTETQLTNYAISCLSKGSHKITKSQIPNGTKIKNLYDNHIWVFNTMSLGGLTQYTWEDFGSDNICIATNEGVKGLVTGSTDSLKGYIDINGVISINGLEETLTEMTEIIGALVVKVEQLELRLENSIER